MVFIALCLPVLMMLLMLGMDAFENFISRPSPASLEAAKELPAQQPARQELD
ncbi:hypothetical protein OG760_34825 [Streptomyces sp. NBC_00963]|uniref:hypothetical protein n=1 Tax=Streptomyces sp. NBC_00963 TaxID=2903697 RepID=UPI00386EDC23|nr:hypothetical protein OG760_34825 [Streptomyces sp. NBC_00963]